MSDWDLFAVHFGRSVGWYGRVRYLRNKRILVHLMADFLNVPEAYARRVARLRRELGVTDAGWIPE